MEKKKDIKHRTYVFFPDLVSVTLCYIYSNYLHDQIG